MAIKPVLVRVLKRLKEETYYCLVTELDKMDSVIMESPAYDHLETAVCFILWQIKNDLSFSSRDVVLRVEKETTKGGIK